MGGGRGEGDYYLLRRLCRLKLVHPGLQHVGQAADGAVEHAGIRPYRGDCMLPNSCATSTGRGGSAARRDTSSGCIASPWLDHGAVDGRARRRWPERPASFTALAMSGRVVVTDRNGRLTGDDVLELRHLGSIGGHG